MQAFDLSLQRLQIVVIDQHIVSVAKAIFATGLSLENGLPGLVLPGGGDASRLRNYTQVFRYDEAGNLLSLKHGQLPKRLSIIVLKNLSVQSAVRTAQAATVPVSAVKTSQLKCR